MGNTIFWVVTLHFVISIFFLVYVAVYWISLKGYIFANGWTLEWCNPVAELEIPLYFVPVVNAIVTYFSLKMVETLAEEVNSGQVVNVYLWKFGIHYQETD